MDFYWNYYLIQNEIIMEKSKTLKFEDIEMDFNAFYLKIREDCKATEKKIVRIELDSNGRIGLDNAII